ncbi:GNAT family N-acetyltransferase [Sporolactobacillus vineae]|uniref:GNAT family N-acetyltransferase n=1 Tax=Sporolactobacillus vineae TaxID=444463 RepID=UPI000287A571|nr:GNAT family N-acetyltransferase [Sporolactobacillus vineae]
MELHEASNRFYFLDDDGKEAGEVTFTKPYENVLSIDHTFVDPAYRGQKLAGQLIQAVVDKAVREHKKIIPVCSYAQAKFRRVKAYQDVEYHGA